MKRIFTGIKIVPNNNFISIVDEIKLELRMENIRWVNYDNYHMTLKFFGDTDEARIEQICSLYENIAPDYSSFTYRISDIGTFDRNRVPKILWFDTLDNEPIYKLADGIETALVKLGYNREKRPFKAHLTVGGIRYINDKKHFREVIEKYKNVFIQEVFTDRFILYQSTLKPGGPTYTELKSWNLKKT
jgi:RNA 2',3'-cyclic 3'-phosphodiesterase